MQQDKSKLQGEGDYAADRRYTQSVQAFVKSGKVGEAARKAAPTNQREQRDMESAESTGESHSKGEDADPVPASAVKP